VGGGTATPRGNLEHVVLLQETGIFLIETKAHEGRISFSGIELEVAGQSPEKDFIAQVHRNTCWLKEVKTEIDNLRGGAHSRARFPAFHDAGATHPSRKHEPRTQ